LRKNTGSEVEQKKAKLVEKEVPVAGSELNDACGVVGRCSDRRLPVCSFEVRLDHFVVFAVTQCNAVELRTFVPGNNTARDSKSYPQSY